MIVRRAATDAEPGVVVKPADFARALDAGSLARTSYHRLSCSRKREHVLAIESAKADTRVPRIEKALAMLRYQESAGDRRSMTDGGRCWSHCFPPASSLGRDGGS